MPKNEVCLYSHAQLNKASLSHINVVFNFVSQCQLKGMIYITPVGYTLIAFMAFFRSLFISSATVNIPDTADK